jgi:hypothetical protein
VKIGIYLLGIHQTALRDLIALCDPVQNKITVFTSAKMIGLLNDLNMEIGKQVDFFEYKNNGLRSYNRAVSKKSAELDLLIVSPNSGRKGIASHLFLKPACKWLFIDIIFGDAFLNELGFFRYDPVSNFLYRKLYISLMKKSSGTIYSSREILRIISPRVGKPGFFLPFNLFSGSQTDTIIQESQETVYLTLTGTIEKKRKDMDVLFEAVHLLIQRSFLPNPSVKIVLLGGLLNQENVHGKEAVEKALSINRENSVEIFETFPVNFIDEKTYRNRIEKTSVILNLLNMDQYKYGKFCSGMAECIAYQIPGVYPASYQILEELETSSLRYSGPEELASVIEKVVTDKIYLDSLRANARKNSEQFSLEKYTVKFKSFIDQCKE